MPPCVSIRIILNPSHDSENAVSEASWRSGYAEDCKSPALLTLVAPADKLEYGIPIHLVADNIASVVLADRCRALQDQRVPSSLATGNLVWNRIAAAFEDIRRPFDNRIVVVRVPWPSGLKEQEMDFFGSR